MNGRKIRNSPMRSMSRKGQGRSPLKSIYSGGSSKDRESADFFKQFRPKKKPSITYRAYEIIPRNSPYSHHFKSLLNAESFIAQNELPMALEIYQRLLNKIPLRSSRDKIETNIKDIESFSEEHEEPTAPRVQLDISYSGPPPQLPTTESPQAPGTTTGAPPATTPIQIQMVSAPTSFAAPGLQGAPQGAPAGPAGEMVAPPFGFVQVQQSADQEAKEQLEQNKNKPFGFFDKIQDYGDETPPYKRASEDIVPQTNTEKLLKELTDGIFQIEKALFDTSRMQVESEETPELPEGKAKPKEPEAEAAEEELAEEAPPEEAAETAEEGAPEGIPEEPSEEGVTGAAAEEEEEEELGEGILEKTSEIGSLDEAEEEEEEGEEEKPAVQEIRGVLELKEPEQEDTPFITITYDFNKIPHHFFLSKDHNILEYAYYKYKPMLVKAQRFIRKKQITKALNYYRVIRDQQIPDALKLMVDKNIQDISEYLEKYLMTRPG